MSRWQDQRKNLSISTKEISQGCNYGDVSERDEVVGCSEKSNGRDVQTEMI